jgi:PAS domain S-box-containing protein
MTHSFQRSLSAGNGSSQDRSQDMAETPDHATAEAADCVDRPSNSVLDIQALQILDSSDDCIKMLDLEGRILFMNRGGQALLGIQDRTPLLNTSWVNFWQEEEQQAAMDAIAQAAAGEACSLQGYCPTLNGEPKWWDNKISPILGVDGQVERLLCISRDITERRQIEDKRKQAEEQLRESEERYQAIINQAVTGVACTDLDGNLTIFNQKYCDITGYSADELRQLRMQDITHPEDLPRNVELFYQMRTEGTPFEIEKRYIRKDGSIVWVNNSVSVIHDREGHPQSAVAIVLDITERKQAALNAELLAMVTQDLAEATCVEDVIQTIGEHLNQYLQISICAFVEINESAEVAAIHHGWHQNDIPSLIGVDHLTEFVTGEFFQATKRGQTIIVRDITTDPRIADPQRFAALKIGSFINVPLIRDDEWKFILGIYHPTPYNWRSDEIELMRELANRIWTKLEQTRVEIALRESEKKYRGLFESLDEGFFLADVIFDETNQPEASGIVPRATDILYLEANPAATRMVGQDYTGRRLRDINPSYEEYWYEIFGRVAQTGIGERLEQYAEPDQKWYDFYVFKVGNENSRCVSVVFKDITAAKQLEESRQRREANLAFLAEISEDFSRLSTADEIMQTVGAKMGAYLRVTTCNFTDVDEAHDRVTVHHGWSSPEVPSTVGTFRTSQYLSKEFERASLAGETVVVCNTQTDPRTDAAGYAALNMHSFVTVPFHRNGQWTHYIAICDSRPRDWRDHEIQLIEEISNRIFPRLERARAEEALRESEAKYRSLFESIDQGFCLFELLFDASGKPIDYRFLDVNQAFEQQCGLADAVGKTILELAPNFEPQWIERYAQVAKSGEAMRFEADVPSLNGIFDIYAFPSGAPGQNLVAALFANITERKQTEAAIAADLRDTQLLRDLSARLATEENIQALYQEIMAAAIALTHADAGTVQILDETMQDLLLLATQGFEQKMVDHFYRVNASSNTPCGIALRSSIRSFVDFDVPASEDPDGSMRLHVEAGLLSAQSTPLISRSGKPIGMVSTHWRTCHRPSESELRFLDLLARQAADLIEQRQAEAQRKQLLEQEQAAREEAERANRIKDEFLAVLSHELRSPLNPILGWTKLLRSGKLDVTRTTYALETIERNTQLQVQLIDDLLDISRILRGKLVLAAARVDLKFVISAALETVRLAAEAKSQQIETIISPIASPVNGDAGRLQQVVWNLLSNAIKFTPVGGRITVELSSDAISARIQVKDTGKGIKPDFLPYLFEHFRQEDGATTRKFGGLGLGLAIAKQITEMHGGMIRAESQGEGMGATFVVELPLSKNNKNPERTRNLSLSTQHSALNTSLSGLHILLVDDEPDTREFQTFVLEQGGAKVTAVASGFEALQTFNQFTPDVLVSDIGMAEMDGYALMQQIRSRLSNQDKTFPAIALTAYARDLDQQQAIAAGFHRHLTKPIEPEKLISAIVHLLKESRASQYE